MEHICHRCGKVFSTTKRTAKYCSQQCHNPPLFKVCANCGLEFRVSPSAKAQRFCSRHCAYTSQETRDKKRRDVIAAWNDPEKRQRFMAGIEQRSQSEDWLSAPHFQKGALHPRYKGNKRNRSEHTRYLYKKWKSDVLKKDNFTCQVCGKRGGFLHAHHIKEWAQVPESRYEVSNGMAVCEDCHIELHGRKWKPLTRTCKGCGQQFRPKRGNSQYCNRECFLASIRLK